MIPREFELGSFDVDRSALLKRVVDSGARIVMLTAPAGYGKSRFARSLMARWSLQLAADCADMTSVAAAVRTLLRALGPFSADFEERRSQYVLALPTNGSADDRWMEVLDEALEQPDGSRTVCLENSEALTSVVGVEHVVDRALRDNGRRFIICSRVPLTVPALSRVPPHERYDIGIDDLRFTPQEIAALFHGAPVDETSLQSVTDLSRGWPIAVFVFLRAAQEGHLETALSDVSATASLQGLRTYMLTQALGSLGQHAREVLAATALIGGITRKELRAMSSTPGEVEAEFRLCPFVAETANGFEVHPLAIATLADMRTVGARVLSESASRLDDPVRAAQFYLAAGDQDSAATVLDGLGAAVNRAESAPEIAAIVASLDRQVLLRHPATWNLTWIARMFTSTPQQHLAEARTIWNRLTEETPAELRVSIGMAVQHGLFLLGPLQEAVELVDVLERIAATEPASVMPYIMMGERALTVARAGKYVDVDVLHAKCDAVFEPIPMFKAIAEYLIYGPVAFMKGERGTARRAFSNAVELASAPGSSDAILVNTLVTAAFYAWLAGEDELFETYVRRLQKVTSPHVAPATTHFIACAIRERPEQAATGCEFPYMRAYAWLVAASRMSEGEARRSALLAAIDAANEDTQPVVRALAWASLGIAEPSRASDAFAMAKRHAAEVEYTSFSRSIEQITRGQIPDQWAGLRKLIPEVPVSVEISVFRLAVFVDGKEVKLSGRELEVVVALALSRGKAEREMLAERVWPDQPTDAARQNLKVYINRLRRRLPTAAIVSSRDEYVLNVSITIDVDRVHEILTEIDAAASEVGETELERLKIAGEADIDALGAKTRNWEWFGDHMARLDEIVRSANLSLAQYHAARHEWATSLVYSKRIFEREPSDDQAFVLLRQALNGVEDRLGAARASKQHEAALREIARSI